MQVNLFKSILQKYYEEYINRNKIPLYCRKAIEKILDCKTEYAGGQVYICPECGEMKNVYNSCRHRSCPFCREKLNKEWYNKQIKRLPNLKYQHIVFTVPHELNKLYLKKKEAFTGIIFKSVEESLKKRLKYLKLESGYILQLHTNGGNQNLHLHIHCLILKGGLNNVGNYEKVEKVFLWMPKLIDDYREKLLKLCKELSESEDIKRIRKASKRNWHIKLVEEFNNQGKSVLKYLSKSKSGGSINNEMLLKVKNGLVHFTNKNKSKEYKLKGLEFIRRILLHIPKPSQKLTRNYGLFHAKNQEKLSKLVEEFGVISEEELETKSEVMCLSCKKVMLPTLEILKLEKMRNYQEQSLFIIKNEN